MLSAVLLATSAQSRNLVLTTVVGNKVDPQILIRSFLSSTDDGDIVVIGEGPSFDISTKEFCSSRRVSFVSSHAFSSHSHSPLVDRFIWYREFLQAHSGEYGKVIHTDAHDALFQGDPWEHVPQDSVAIGCSPRSISSTSGNSFFIMKCYGSSTMRALGSLQSVCAGFICGGTSAFIAFMSAFESEIQRIHSRECLNGVQFDNMQAGDQAIITHLTYLASLPVNVTRIQCMESLFVTEKYCIGPLTTNGTHIIRKSGVSRVPVYIHQYNRNSALLSFARKKYCSLPMH